MTVTDTTAAPTQPNAPVEGRAYETVYGAVVIDGPELVLNERYPHQSARRDAVVELLLANHDEIEESEIREILEPFGGASGDHTLNLVASLYAEYGVDVYLTEHQQDVGPAVLYSAFTDYGDGSTFVEHYGSREERLTELRQRALNLSEDYPTEFFQNADEETCRKIIEYRIVTTNGRLHLFEANRQDVGGAYLAYQSKE